MRQLTDAFGQRMVSYMYDGFGNVRGVWGTADNPYGFTGESRFPEADNLIFLCARYYAPALGRFLSRDPILAPVQLQGTVGWLLPYLNLDESPQALHPYLYVKNNPVNYVDPSGLMPFTECYVKCFTVGTFWCYRFSGPAHDKCIVGVGLICAGICVWPLLPPFQCPSPEPPPPIFLPGDYFGRPVIDAFWTSLPRN
ncbi:MAG TPA: RHS repeat-associated core domain-containing protein [Anaerohalosphaeraceae bacterium]|nr:RHS repeat-associated core domain-containing protein [Anaerohalosphaeraceae bacterium]